VGKWGSRTRGRSQEQAAFGVVHRCSNGSAGRESWRLRTLTLPRVFVAVVLHREMLTRIMGAAAGSVAQQTNRNQKGDHHHVRQHGSEGIIHLRSGFKTVSSFQNRGG